jgi:hypothetical protein
MLCVGKKEEAAETIDIRDRDEGKSIGVFNVANTINLFKSKYPAPCEEETAMKAKAYFSENEQELTSLNKELALKVFLSGEGF